MIYENIEDITMNYEINGELLVKELKKNILSKGVWVTIMFLYQRLNKTTGEYGKLKAAIRRYKRIKGFYQLQTKFSFSSDKQAKEVANTLNKWIALYGAE